MGVSVDSLTREEAIKELERLAREIAHHDYLYFELSAPEISDAEYDSLVQRNRAIEKRFPDLRRADSPTLRVGATPASGFKKVKHRFPMLSLDNAFQDQDIYDFIKRVRRFLSLSADHPVEIVAEPKIDGVSAALHYQNGKFVLATTRGDGHTGEDITENVRTLSDVPPQLAGSDVPESLEVRGEIYIGRQDFLRLNQQRNEGGEAPFANPRNAAAGSLRQLDPTVTAQRPLHFFAYAAEALSGSPAKTQWDTLKTLRLWGFPVCNEVTLCADEQAMLAFYAKLGHLRANLDFDIDGVVYKVNSFDWQQRLGVIGRSPRHSIAHKFPAEQAETVVEEIIIQVGRTGVLTPVAVLRPVTVGGVVVSRATLHNRDEIKRKDIRVHDHVVIQRAGDVIPQVVRVLVESRSPGSRTFDFPEHCPVCGGLVVVREHEVAVRCSEGLTCPAQVVERLKHFVSRYAFDIEGLGSRNVEQFYQDGLIKNPVDIFTFEERDRSQLQTREGWGEVSAQKLFQAIASRRRISLDRFIYALGIPQIGSVTAKVVARHYQSMQRWQEHMILAQDQTHAAWTEFLSLEGVGPSIAADAVIFFAQEHNVDIVNRLLQHVSIVPYVSTQETGSPISGKSIVFTGTLTFQGRAEAKARAEQLGARVLGSVSPKTDLVVVGEDPGAKAKQAQEFGVRIVTEQEWKDICQWQKP